MCMPFVGQLCHNCLVAFLQARFVPELPNAKRLKHRDVIPKECWFSPSVPLAVMAVCWRPSAMAAGGCSLCSAPAGDEVLCALKLCCWLFCFTIMSAALLKVWVWPGSSELEAVAKAGRPMEARSGSHTFSRSSASAASCSSAPRHLLWLFALSFRSGC